MGPVDVNDLLWMALGIAVGAGSVAAASYYAYGPPHPVSSGSAVKGFM